MMFIGAAAFTFGLIIIGPSPPIRDKFGKSVAMTSVGMVFLTIGSSIVIASWPVAFNAVVSRLKVDSKSLETMSWVKPQLTALFTDLTNHFNFILDCWNL